MTVFKQRDIVTISPSTDLKKLISTMFSRDANDSDIEEGLHVAIRRQYRFRVLETLERRNSNHRSNTTRIQMLERNLIPHVDPWWYPHEFLQLYWRE